MTHRHIRQQLSACLDNELSVEERKKVEAHLRTCSECQEILEDFQQHDRWIAALSEPVDVWETISQRISRRDAGQTQIKSRRNFPFVVRHASAIIARSTALSRLTTHFRPVPLGIVALVIACLILAWVYFLNPTEEFYNEVPLNYYFAFHIEYTSDNPVRSNTAVDAFSVAGKTDAGPIDNEFLDWTQFLIDAHVGD